MKTTSVTALIPVRAGSRRLKNKNILPFGDSNLLIHKIRQLKQVKEITTIVVSSDSDIMLQMASDEGVETCKRPKKYCDDVSVPVNEVVKYICKNTIGEHLLWAPCVCPLMGPLHYSEAIKIYLKNKDHDSLVSVARFKEFLWDENGSVNYDASRRHVISQDLPLMWIVTNGIYLAKRKDMIKWEYFLGKKPYKYEVDKITAVDIDDGEDYEMAKALYITKK